MDKELMIYEILSYWISELSKNDKVYISMFSIAEKERRRYWSEIYSYVDTFSPFGFLLYLWLKVHS